MSDATRIHALAADLGLRLLARGGMLAAAESCTAGGIGFAVTQIAGSSAWFDRGFVTYSNAAKQQMLGVPARTLREHGAVSEAVVCAMALGALAHSRAQIAVAVTGIAGPTGGTRDKPIGTVWFGWALKPASGRKHGEELAVSTERHLLHGDRAAVRTQSIVVALEGLIRVIDRVESLE
jgi:nicotinamide-nucleotide amidase